MTDKELIKLIERIEAKQAEARKWRTKNGCADIGFGTEDELLDALKYSLDRIEALVKVRPPYDFDRYINGIKMAEGVTIERQTDVESACREAARIASKGPDGEVPVLVLAVPH